MTQQSWWGRVIARINATYERRIRAASLVTEYGAAHHGHHAGHDQAPDHAAEDEDEGAAVITNVPRGTRIAHSPTRGEGSDRH